MAQKITKAGGNIVQADWLQTDPSKMDYIHNKPDLENIGGLTEEEVIEIINENLPDIPQPLTEQQVKNIVNNTIPTGTNAAIVRNASGVLDKTVVSSGIDANSIAIRDDKGRLKSSNGVSNWNYSSDSFGAVKTYGVENAVVTTDDLKKFIEKFPINISAIQDTFDDWDKQNETGFIYSTTVKGWIVAPINSGSYYLKSSNTDNWSLFAISDAVNKSSYIPLKSSSGQLKVTTVPMEPSDAASKQYVDSKIYTSTISNRTSITGAAKTIISSSIRFGDLEWVTNPEVEGPVGNTGLLEAYPSLPGDENTVYTLTVTLPTVTLTSEDDLYEMRSAGGCPPIDESIMDISSEWVDYVCSEESGIWYYTQTNSEYSDDGSYIKTYSPVIRSITQTGPWKIVFGECSGGASLKTLEAQKEYYKDAMVHYSYELYEEYPSGSVHSIDLHSDQELHYDYPLTELTIDKLVYSFPQNVSQQWIISFIAGDEAPIITIPHQVELTGIRLWNAESGTSEIVPLEWINGEPSFEANKRYMITFKQINSVVYASCVELPNTH